MIKGSQRFLLNEVCYLDVLMVLLNIHHGSSHGSPISSLSRSKCFLAEPEISVDVWVTPRLALLPADINLRWLCQPLLILMDGTQLYLYIICLRLCICTCMCDHPGMPHPSSQGHGVCRGLSQQSSGDRKEYTLARCLFCRAHTPFTHTSG